MITKFYKYGDKKYWLVPTDERFVPSLKKLGCTSSFIKYQSNNDNIKLHKYVYIGIGDRVRANDWSWSGYTEEGKNAFKDFHQFITNQQALDFQKVYEDQQAHLTLSSTMKELFNYLKEKNISYGIITNGKEKTQMNKINSLFPIIDFPIIISEKVGYQKPQKEIFELIQGNDSYYVGDGYEIDMMGAYQAGVKTIWYNHQKQEKDTSFIDFVVYSDEELLEVVKKLNND